MFIILFVNLFDKTDNKMLWYMLYMYQVYLICLWVFLHFRKMCYATDYKQVGHVHVSCVYNISTGNCIWKVFNLETIYHILFLWSC